MSLSTVEKTNTPETPKNAREKTFNPDAILVDNSAATYTSEKTTFHPVLTSVEDGYETGLNACSLTSNMPESNLTYGYLTKGIDQENPHIAAELLHNAYEMVKGEDENFHQPAAVLFNKNGQMAWSAGTEAGSMALVYVRQGKEVEQLGGEDAGYGVVEKVHKNDVLYMIPNDSLLLLEATEQVSADNLKALHRNETSGVDMIRYRFNEAVRPTVGDFARDRHKQRKQLKKSSSISDEAEEVTPTQTAFIPDSDRGFTSTTSPKRLERERIERLSAIPIPMTPDAGEPITGSRTTGKEVELYTGVVGKELELYHSPIGQSEIKQGPTVAEVFKQARLEDRIERLTEKVTSYEEIAADALGRRMKGRLFKPLRRSSKDKAAEDEQNVYLLDGFTRALDGALMQQWTASGMSEEDVVQNLYDHQQARQAIRADRNHEEMTKGRVASWMDRYANAPKKKKIAYTLGAGAVLAVAGAGVAAAAAAGAGLAVAGGAGLVTAKAVKSYGQHRSKLYIRDRAGTHDPNALVVAKDDVITRKTAIEQVFEGRNRAEYERAEALKKADRNKKLATGMAAVAGLALGGGIALKVVEHTDDFKDFLTSLPKPPIDNIPEIDISGNDPAVIEHPPVVDPPEVTHFSTEARAIFSGEGWYQTFNDMGITDPTEQASLLQKVGPVLQERDWAYPMDDGTWGISRSGELPTDVLELIEKSR